MRRCLCIGTTEGEKNFTANVKRQIKKICRKYGAMYLSGYPVKNWEHGRYTDPYIREDLNDYGIIIDTLEAGVYMGTICIGFIRAFGNSLKTAPGQSA